MKLGGSGVCELLNLSVLLFDAGCGGATRGDRGRRRATGSALTANLNINEVRLAAIALPVRVAVVVSVTVVGVAGGHQQKAPQLIVA